MCILWNIESRYKKASNIWFNRCACRQTNSSNIFIIRSTNWKFTTNSTRCVPRHFTSNGIYFISSCFSQWIRTFLAVLLCRIWTEYMLFYLSLHFHRDATQISTDSLVLFLFNLKDFMFIEVKQENLFRIKVNLCNFLNSTATIAIQTRVCHWSAPRCYTRWLYLGTSSNHFHTMEIISARKTSRFPSTWIPRLFSHMGSYYIW